MVIQSDGGEVMMTMLGQLRLESMQHPWLWMLLVVLVVGLTVAAYGQIHQRSGRSLVWGLMSMRIAAVVLLLFVLLKPVWVSSQSSPRRPVVAVIVDTSQSMSQIDHGTESRYEQVQSWHSGPTVEMLKQRFDLKWYNEAGVELEAGVLPTQPTGARSDLGRAVSRVQRELRGQDAAGVILVSDGRDTQRDTTVPAMQDAPIAVHTIGFQAPDRDALTLGSGDVSLSLNRIDAPRRGRVGNQLMIHAVVSKRGGGAVTSQLSLQRMGQTLASVPISFQDGSNQQNVTLTWTPQRVGDFALRARVAAVPREINTADNIRTLQIRVESEPIRVLLLEGVLRPGYPFLRDRLRQDPDIDLVSVVRTASGPQGRAAFQSATRQIMTPERLKQFDVVLLGDVQASMLDETSWVNLQRWIIGEDTQPAEGQDGSTTGGALLVLGGYANLGPEGLLTTPLAGALPVELSSISQTVAGPFTFTLTPAGLNHPATRLLPEPARTRDLLQQQPKLAGIIATGKTRPAATVLARHPESNPAEPQGAGYVVLAIQPYGQGQVALLTADTLWRWSRAARLAGVADTAYARFWSQCIRYLAGRKTEQPDALVVSTDQTDYEQDDPVKITATLDPTAGELAGFETSTGHVRTALELPNGERVDVPMSQRPSDPTVWQGVAYPGVGGLLRVESQWIAQGQAHVDATSDFRVSSSVTEMADPRPDPAWLRRLATEGNGFFAYIRGDTAQQAMLDALDAQPRVRTTVSTSALWNSPWLLLIFIVLLAVEWTLRRRHRLV